jgi:hypothetical protein
LANDYREALQAGSGNGPDDLENEGDAEQGDEADER